MVGLVFRNPEGIEGYTEAENFTEANEMIETYANVGYTLVRIMQVNQEELTMKESAFEIGEIEAIYKGYAEGTHWNGWACPWFTFDVAKEIMNEYNISCDGDCMIYNSREDMFAIVQANGDIEKYEGKDFIVNGKNLHLYPVGNSSWVWDDIAENQSKESKIVWDYLAEQYFWYRKPKTLWTIYHTIILGIDSYMSERELKIYTDGFMAAWEAKGRK